MATLNRTKWETEGLTANRCNGFVKNGFTGNHVTPTSYVGYGGTASTPCPTLPNGARQPRVDWPNQGYIVDFNSNPFGSIPSARNRAWAKFIENARGNTAELGMMLAEFDQSFDMVTGRSLQLMRAYRNLRQGNFKKFLKELRLKPKRKHRGKVRSGVNDASSLWLEYSFGWSPLVGDIYNALQVTAQPKFVRRVSGSGTQMKNFKSPSGATPIMNISGRGSVRISADVVMTNPNAFYMQSLGLANPALVAYELVPFSFLVDWVFDVSSFLGSFTDLMGLSTSRPSSTAFLRGKGTAVWSTSGQPTYYRSRKVTCYAMRRQNSLVYPLPNTSYTANIGTSLKRAANAVSLLGQILTK